MKLSTSCILALGLVAALGVSACGDSNEPGSGSATFRLVNNSGATVDAVFFSMCDNPSWGSDQLNANETVASGSTRNFDLTVGCWDFRADYLNAGTDTDLDVNITNGQTYTWTLAPLVAAAARNERSAVKVGR